MRVRKAESRGRRPESSGLPKEAQCFFQAVRTLLFTALTCALIFAAAAALLSSAQTASARTPSAQSVRTIFPEPALPALPAAGGTFRDPVFGTEVMRVTDARDGKLNGTFYPHWPTLNADSTRLLVKRYETGDAVYSFDPVNFKLGDYFVIPRLPDNGTTIKREPMEPTDRTP